MLRKRWGWGFTQGFGVGAGFSDKVKSLFGSSLIGYWPMNEESGLTINDISDQLNNGVYTGVDLANENLPSQIGGKAPFFDGTNDIGNVYSTGLVADFNGAAGTAILLAKVYNVGVWTDGNTRHGWRLLVDGTNYIVIRIDSAGSQLDFTYVADGTSEKVSKTGLSETGWMFLAITWDKAANEMRAFYNGVQEGTTQTIAGTWVGSLGVNTTLMGSSSSSTAAFVWHGYLAHGQLLNRAATPAEILQVAQWGGFA